jgi:tungstate transport system permease protein
LAATMTRQIIGDAHQQLGERLQSLGANRLMTALLLLINERHALMTVLVTCFGRAISEVGTVMMVGGNIEGFTRVMTTAIALETSKGDLPLAIGLGVVLLAVVLLLNGLLSALRSLQPAEPKAS